MDTNLKTQLDYAHQQGFKEAERILFNYCEGFLTLRMVRDLNTNHLNEARSSGYKDD